MCCLSTTLPCTPLVTEELGTPFDQKITVGFMKLMHLQLPLDITTDVC